MSAKVRSPCFTAAPFAPWVLTLVTDDPMVLGEDELRDSRECALCGDARANGAVGY